MDNSPSFCEWYTSLSDHDKESKRKIVRFFEKKDGEYFTAHGATAEWIADDFFKTRDVIKMLGPEDNKIAGVCIRPGLLEKILRNVLMEKKENVELYAPGGDGQYVVKKKASPGNIEAFEDILSSDAVGFSENAVVAVKLHSDAQNLRVLGVAFVDTTLRRMEICEFEENERFGNLQSVLVQKGAKECYLGYEKSKVSPGDLKKLQGVMEQLGIPVIEKKASDFKSNDIDQDLTRLLGSTEKHLAELEKRHAIAALSALIKDLQVLRDETGFKRWKLRTFDLTNFMKLDQAAVKALNLFPQASDSDKNMSLFGLLNKTKTLMGQRLLYQWIKQPLLSKEKIERRLNYVELFYEETHIRQALQESHLKGIPDLDRVIKRIQSGKGNLQNVIAIYTWVLRLPSLKSTLEEYKGPYEKDLQTEFIDKLQVIIKDLSLFEAMVETTIDLEALDKHEYVINPAFSPELETISKQKKQIMKKMDDMLEQVASDLDLDTKLVKLNNASNLGWHFRVSRKNEKSLRSQKQYTALETRKDGVRFTSPKMKSLSRSLVDLTKRYEVMQDAIVQKCLKITAGYSVVIDDASALLAELDALVSFAHVSANAVNPYRRPHLLPQGTGKIVMKAARHPCLEAQASVDFIPNDLRLVRGESNVQVITGPNMGGKSTYIRMTGVICLLAQIGCFVPCEGAEISIVDCILARVGAGDSQLKGVSTFMKEMLEASSILQEATKDSLIIIDELGRGTSTYDGFGLAWAIAEYIAKEKQCFALFATHFHELTALADQEPSVVNKHVTAIASENNITMLYKVKEGPCDRSFGIHVSELAQFPAIVVEEARKKAAELEDFGDEHHFLGHMGVVKRKSEQEGGGKKRKVDDEELVKKFCSIPLDSLSDEALKAELEKLLPKD